MTMRRPIRILELRSVRGTGGGPEKTILSGAALSDPERYAVTVCYIRDLRDSVFAIDVRAADLKVDYVEIHEHHSFDVSIWPALRRLTRQRAIQIVHSHDYKTNFYAWLLSKVEPVVPLATLHGYTGQSPRERVYYAADKRIVRRFPMLIAVSEDLRRELIRTGSRADRVVRVLNGIDDTAFRRDRALEREAREAIGLAPDHVVIGTVGRLERQKRFDVLMEAFRGLRSRPGGSALRLVIAGDGSLREALEAERARLGLESSCLLVGHRSDVVRLHHAFDLFVQSSDYEGTPNSVLEAMALETPIIATDVGGTSELVTDGVHGLIVPPQRPEAIITAVERALRDTDATRKRVANARSRVERELSFRARMAAVERIYDALTDSAGRTATAGALGRA
jgi:glycosyltransferase involved in cell wall biosynthesis